MKTRTLIRLSAAAVVTVVAYALCGAAGLWGVALAAPALVFAPSAVKQAVAERKTKRALDAELSRIFGRDRDRG
jgi:hypothetical protein